MTRGRTSGVGEIGACRDADSPSSGRVAVPLPAPAGANRAKPWSEAVLPLQPEGEVQQRQDFLAARHGGNRTEEDQRPTGARLRTEEKR